MAQQERAGQGGDKKYQVDTNRSGECSLGVELTMETGD